LQKKRIITLSSSDNGHSKDRYRQHINGEGCNVNRRNTYQKIGIAAAIMMASIFLSRVIGVVREIVIAAVAGASGDVDAYRVAFVLPEILNHLLASGFLSVTFIPIFTKYLAKDDETGAWNIFSTILTTFGCLLAILLVLSMVLSHQILPYLVSGRQNADFFSTAVRMTRIILPAQLFFFAGGLLMAVQFAKEQFMIPALAPLIYNLGIICGGLFLGPFLGMEGFCWGALGGAFMGNFLVQIAGARKVGLRFKPRFNLSHRDLRHYIKLTLPLMLGLTMVFSMEIFSKLFGSYLPEGGIAWLDYAKTIMMMLVGFFGQAVGVAAFPFLARMAAEERWAEMNQIFNTLLRRLAALVIPAAVLMYVLRTEIVRVLFERGQFLPKDTQMTAIALSGMLVGAVAIAAMTVVNRGFYAMQNTLLPAVYGTIAVVASLPVYWLGLKTFGLFGIALAVSVSAIFQVVILFAAWNRRSGNRESKGVYATTMTATAASVPLGAVLWVAHKILLNHIDPVPLHGSMMVICGVTVLFVTLMAVGGWIFKVEGIREMEGRVIDRLRAIKKPRQDSGA
jgi:putative peptidoglycan lipid II flippase